MKSGSVFRQFFKFHYDYENKDSIILRDFLSLERTRLANERTLLAYLRTALYLLLGGLALVELSGHDNLHWLGYIAIALSILFVVVGLFRFSKLKSQLHKFYEGTERDE